MKLALVAPFAAFVLAACSGSSNDPSDIGSSPDNDITKDACYKPALSAAEQEYGNDPTRTKVVALTKGAKYVVTVGIDNAEDGPHDYYVTFPSGCSSTPKVSEVPDHPHALRDAAHTAYDKILWANGDHLDASHGISESALPAAAKKQLDTWVKNGKSTCSAVNAYEVDVSGQKTYAVGCDVVGDSIKFSFAIWDDKGADVDQAACYGLSSGVGDKGVSWQNETFEETPH